MPPGQVKEMMRPSLHRGSQLLTSISRRFATSSNAIQPDSVIKITTPRRIVRRLSAA
jgi:hypothetical protein